MADKSSKTEEATPKRLRDAKKRGQVAKSGDFNSAFSFFIFTLLITTLGPYSFDRGLLFMANSLNRDYSQNLSQVNIRNIFTNGIIDLSVFLFPFFTIAVLVAIISNLIQTGFIFTVTPLKINFNRINPIEGFKNIFSKKALFTLVKNILKLILVFYLTYKNISESIAQLINSGMIGTERLFYFMIEFVRQLSINIAIIMLILAIVDYIFQRRDFKKDMMMTKQEVKDEYKEMEGDPQIKSSRRQKQRQIAMSRTMSGVEDSTVVITNPNHIAIALRYDGTRDSAPVLTAKGVDYIAKKIKEKARECSIPIIENKDLARAIYREVEIGDYIPVELYKAVAEILAIVHQMKERSKKKI